MVDLLIDEFHFLLRLDYVDLLMHDHGIVAAAQVDTMHTLQGVSTSVYFLVVLQEVVLFLVDILLEPVQ
jgi:hypothetical protein